jgi:lipopolysaccharide export LptBFGC system permease protein LptF
MSKNIHKHFWHYVVYLLIFAGGLLLIFINRNNTGLEAFSIILTGFFYFVWSMVHHHVHHQLNSHVIIEYILIVILGTVLALFLFGV